jgi:uncharacterized glyoxalase superfamily metalloenzyme YdcJ
MRSVVLLLWLTLVVPVAQAADWLAWRKVGDATLTWGPFTVYTSQLRTPDGRYGRDPGSGADYYLCARHRSR